MTHTQKDALILSLLPLVQQLNYALADIAVLKTRIAGWTRPPMTPDNSSTPPSKAQKPDRSAQKALRHRRARPGVSRALHENPDHVVEAYLQSCPHCQTGFPAARQTAASRL